MENNSGKKKTLKMLYLAKIFTELTDDEHGLTLPQIQEKLAEYGISADRKILYQDFDLLRDFGLDILMEREGNQSYYHMGERTFELPELKLLVDSVQASKFITENKSRELIKKLESLVSVYEAKQLHRQVVISGRLKSGNESVYYTVDRIHDAIGADRQIRFHYFNWSPEKKIVLRRNGEFYQVSPWCLTWDDENYYLVAYESSAGEIRHYRVDKMLDLSLTEEKREGREAFSDFDISDYSKQVFGMFHGEIRPVTLRCRNDMAGVMIDRFGTDIMMIPADEENFDLTVEVALSEQFYGWIISLGSGVQIAGPEDVVGQMRELIERLREQYS